MGVVVHIVRQLHGGKSLYMYQPVFIRKKYVHIMYRENIALSEEKLPNNKNETGRMLL